MDVLSLLKYKEVIPIAGKLLDQGREILHGMNLSTNLSVRDGKIIVTIRAETQDQIKAEMLNRLVFAISAAKMKFPEIFSKIEILLETANARHLLHG